MERLTITVYQDDCVEDILERMQFVLNELGIKMRISESDNESVVYSLIQSERLGDAQEEI